MAALEELLPEVLAVALEYVRGLPQRQVRTEVPDEELRAILDDGLPADPSEPAEVVRQLVAAGGGLVPSGSGKYFGYVVGGTLPAGLAADWLTSVWDQNCIVHDGSPLTAVLEEICGRWLAELFMLPATTSYAFTPACTHADLLGLTVARHQVLARHGWDVARQGLQGGPAVAVLVNESIHAAVTRPLQVLGLGGSIRSLPTDTEGRILLPALREEIDAVRGQPLIVCGHVGEINTGGVDRLRPLAELTHEAGGWLHLDAAFGAWAAASPHLRHTLLDGLELADSLATDAHKWLNAPYDCGIALIADAQAHREALPLSADYLNLPDDQRHPVQWGLEVSRRSRVIPLWTILRQLGAAGVAQLVEERCAQAQRLAGHLRAEPGIDVLNDVALNQVLVRFHHSSGPDDDTHTQDVADAFQEHGQGWAGTSLWKGRTVLRLSLSNWASTNDDIDQAARSLIATHQNLTVTGQ